MRKRLAVLASGRGSNLRSIHAATLDPSYPAEIVGVLCDVPEAGALPWAASVGLPTACVPKKRGTTRAEHEAALQTAIAPWKPDLLVLAGYMRVLSPAFVAAREGAIVNIHPSLLPDFPGLDTHRRALEDGAKRHGCTVHFVTAGVDEGPRIASAATDVLSDDTEEVLARRVLALEHRLYPLAIADVVNGIATP